MSLQNEYIKLIDLGISIIQQFASQSQLEMYTNIGKSKLLISLNIDNLPQR